MNIRKITDIREGDKIKNKLGEKVTVIFKKNENGRIILEYSKGIKIEKESYEVDEKVEFID